MISSPRVSLPVPLASSFAFHEVVVGHLGHVVDEPRPSVATRIIGDLLVDQTHAERRQDVQFGLVVEAGLRQALPERRKDLHRLRVRAGGGLEARDGALEEELVAHRVGSAKVEGGPESLADPLPERWREPSEARRHHLQEPSLPWANIAS